MKTHTHTIWGGSNNGVHLRTEPIRTLWPWRTQTVKTRQVPTVRAASCTPLHKTEQKQAGRQNELYRQELQSFCFCPPLPNPWHTLKRKTSQMLKIEIKWLDWGLQKSARRKEQRHFAKGWERFERVWMFELCHCRVNTMQHNSSLRQYVHMFFFLRAHNKKSFQ